MRYKSGFACWGVSDGWCAAIYRTLADYFHDARTTRVAYRVVVWDAADGRYVVVNP